MGKLFILSASSGAGKTTVVNKLIQLYGTVYNLKRLITYTSRPMRSDEVNGKDYHFLSKELFAQKIKEGFFIEWSTAYNNYYGSSWHSVKDSEQECSLVCVLDCNGAQEIRKTFSNDKTSFIWMHAPLDVLKERLKGRGQDAQKVIEQRLHIAQKEQELVNATSLYDYSICNRELIETINTLKGIIHKELIGR